MQRREAHRGLVDVDDFYCVGKIFLNLGDHFRRLPQVIVTSNFKLSCSKLVVSGRPRGTARGSNYVENLRVADGVSYSFRARSP